MKTRLRNIFCQNQNKLKEREKTSQASGNFRSFDTSVFPQKNVNEGEEQLKPSFVAARSEIKKKSVCYVQAFKKTAVHSNVD